MKNSNINWIFLWRLAIQNHLKAKYLTWNSIRIRYKYQKIWSWSRRPDTILEIRKKAAFLKVIKNVMFLKKKRLTGWYFLAGDLRVDFYIQGPPMRPSNNLEHKTTSDTYWRVQLVWMNLQAEGSWKAPLEYNKGQMLFVNHGSLWPFWLSWELQRHALSG